MKKVGILTINDDDNYGNRLQNYASQEILRRRKYKVETIINIEGRKGVNYWKYKLKNFIRKTFPIGPKFKRYRNFIKFNKKIKYSPYIISKYRVPRTLADKYDYFITGSDQVWNPTFKRTSNNDFLNFVPREKRNSLSASFGVSEIPNDNKKEISTELEKFNNISVRETRAKEIIFELTGRKDVEVLVDPTMMLNEYEWEKVIRKPKKFKFEKYILNYFLGELSEQKKEEIEKIAKLNNCEIINIMDYRTPFYECGPSEFLYLERNATLICTDSFHACIFAILFSKPFIIFKREQKNMENMNSRLETLLEKFNLTDRYYKGTIKECDLVIDYSKTKKVLQKERERFEKFLDKIFGGEK